MLLRCVRSSTLSCALLRVVVVRAHILSYDLSAGRPHLLSKMAAAVLEEESSGESTMEGGGKTDTVALSEWVSGTLGLNRCLSACLPACLPICPSFCPSISPSVSMLVWPSVSVSVSIAADASGGVGACVRACVHACMRYRK